MKKFLFLFIFIVSLYFSGRVFLNWNAPNSERSDRVSFSIPKGAGLNLVIEILDEKKLIKDPLIFKLFVYYHGLQKEMQAGEYVVSQNLTFEELTQILQNGRSKEQKITIPEGFTISQIDNLLTKKNIITQGSFLECANTCQFPFHLESLEGYLFPSTYYESINSFSNKKFIQRLYNTFLQQIKPLKSDIKKTGRTLNQIVKVASMIEREAFGSDIEEKKIIAGIIWKRFDEGIHLGIDATTRYEKNEWQKPLYAQDFKEPTPYNTRKKLGLPPTAISNPGIPSLKAAIYPQKTEYYYYLHNLNTGKIHFAKTNAGHEKNKKLYLY